MSVSIKRASPGEYVTESSALIGISSLNFTWNIDRFNMGDWIMKCDAMLFLSTNSLLSSTSATWSPNFSRGS